MQLAVAVLEPCSSIVLSTCAPLFIIPTVPWFGLEGTLRSTFSNQEAFHGERAKKGYFSMCTDVSRWRSERHDRALIHKGAKGAEGAYNKRRKFRKMVGVNFAINLKDEISHANLTPTKSPPHYMTPMVQHQGSTCRN